MEAADGVAAACQDIAAAFQANPSRLLATAVRRG
jgi:hypothetical protein